MLSKLDGFQRRLKMDTDYMPSEYENDLFHYTYGLNLLPDINVQRDRMQILTLCITSEKENSLFAKFPDIAKEWDYEKNENLSPKMFSYGSNRKVWWKCSACQESWQTKINSRVSLGTGCPICGRKKAGRNKALLTEDRFLKNHTLFTEYDDNKNLEINIDTLRIGSKKEVWWLCSKCATSWKAQVYTRIQGFGKCPRCND